MAWPRSWWAPARALPDRFLDSGFDWTRLGAELRDLFDAGLRHADLNARNILVHDEHNDFPSLAFALARLNTDDHSPTPFGVFRDVDRPEYAQSVSDQVMAVSDAKGPGDLGALLRSNGTWNVT